MMLMSFFRQYEGEALIQFGGNFTIQQFFMFQRVNSLICVCMRYQTRSHLRLKLFFSIFDGYRDFNGGNYVVGDVV